MSEARNNDDLKSAINYGLALARLEPENSFLKLVIASNYALSNQPYSSLIWLEKAILGGLTDYRAIDADPDLESLRNLDKYVELIDMAKDIVKDEMDKKSIYLDEGEWKSIKLEDEYEYPKVDFSLKYSPEKLEIKAVVNDLHFKDGNRAWRYGDGFFINFVTPTDTIPGYSDLFYAYGFSLEKGKPIAVLVNKDGTYYLRHDESLTPVINIDRDENIAEYLIKIPWSKLYPFQPLLHQNFGINIIYNSQNDDGSRKRLRYIYDLYYDAEGMNLRRYAPLIFKISAKSGLQIACELESRLLSDNSLNITIAGWLPDQLKLNLEMAITDDKNEEILKIEEIENFTKGRNLLNRKLHLPETEGYYTITVGMNGTEFWKDTFYKYSKSTLSKLKKNVNDLFIELNTRLFTNSLNAITYRLQELEKNIKSYSNRNDPKRIQNEFEKLEELYSKVGQRESIYLDKGYLLSAFRSQLDSTLQPFSIYLPEDFDPSKQYSLLVGLHGSGVNEVGFLRWTAKVYKDANFIIIGPRGRDLSDWYSGKTEEDVVNLIRIIKEMFNINQTILYGFSMGGYGVWRFSFLHAELFDKAICISGPPSPWRGDPGKDDIRNFIGNGKNIEFLVIHGTEDRAVNIESTDDFMDKLKAAGYDLEYIRVEGGGHGDFNVKEMVMKWLSEKEKKK
jgi:predicted esterase